MSQWAREHPDEAYEISLLPLDQQLDALRAAMGDPLERADRARDEERDEA
jgi:hypothetical protein